MAIETTFRNIPDTGSPSWKEPVESISDLPRIGNSVGDARVVENIDSIYIWDGTAWQLAAGGSGVADSFTIIQPDHGTTPVATSPSSTLTLTSSDGSVIITGDAVTDAINFQVPASPGGTVTSVGLSLPTGVFSVSGTPVTSSGTLTGNFLTQSPHTVFAGPGTGSASSIPSFRLLNAADIAFPTSSISQIVYVSSQGSDSTGNGTYNLPYSTIQHALTVIVDATFSKQYVIQMLPGSYVVPGPNVALKPFTYLKGYGLENTFVLFDGGGVTLDAAFVNGGTTGISDITLNLANPSINLGFNLQALGGTSVAAISLNEVVIQGESAGLAFLARTAQDSLTINNCNISNTSDDYAFSIQGGTTNFSNTTMDTCRINQTLTGTTGGFEGQINNCFLGSLEVTGSSAAVIQQYTVVTTPNDFIGVDGVNLTYITDNVSIPINGAFSSGSAQVFYFDDASGVSYNPTNPGDWSPVPTLVQGALDTLAARSVGGVGTVTSVGLSLPSIFSVSGTPVLSSGTLTGALNTQSAHTIFAGPSSGSSIPSFRALISSDIPSLPYASSILPPGQILVGNASSVASPVSMSVDGTLSSSGVLTITEAGGGTGTFKAGVTNVTQLGINNASAPATSPNFTFIDAIGNLATTSAVVQLTGYGTAGGNIGYVTKRARGTLASPAAVQASDKLALFSAYGYGTSQFPVASTGAVNFFANETFTNTSNATYFTIETTPTGSVTRTERVRVNSTGNVLIGTTTDVGGTSLLQVGSASSLQVNSSGNLVKVNNVPYSWPASQGSASTILKNDGSGNLSWGTTTSGISTLSVGTINGFAGSVTSASTTPIINLSTTVTGIIKGNGTSLSAASVSDFPTLNQNTTGTASNITATSNSTLVTLSSLSLPFLQTTGTVPINRGGTGQTTANTGFNALSPMTTSGDIIYGATAGSASRLAIGSNSQILTISGGLPTWQNASGGSGITQLTGDVLSGPGSGSQSASVAFVGGQSASVIASTTLKVLAATSSNTVNTLVLRDANGNTVINNFNTETVLANSGANIAMAASSSFLQRMTPGTFTPQVYTLPDATTLTNTRTFRFINNDTNGWYMTINDHSGTTLYTNNSSGVIDVQLIDNSTTAGTWNLLSYVPGFVTWNLGGLDLGIAGTITTNGDTTAALGLENGITFINDEQTEVIRIVTMDGRHWDIIDNNGIQAQEIDERLFFDLDGNIIFSTGGFNDWDINVPHIETFSIFGASPTITPGTGLGTGGTASVGGGGDTGFNVQTTAGTLPSVSAVIFSIVFVQPYNSAPSSITFSPANAAAAALSSTVFVDRSSITTTGFDFRCSVTGVSAASTPMWDFKVFE